MGLVDESSTDSNSTYQDEAWASIGDKHPQSNTLTALDMLKSPLRIHTNRNDFRNKPEGTETLTGFINWAKTADESDYSIMEAFEAQYHNNHYNKNGINLKVVFFDNQILNGSTEALYNIRTGKMDKTALRRKI